MIWRIIQSMFVPVN